MMNNLLVCEAVSPKSVPQVASILTPEGDQALRNMGFEAPGVSPNYAQTIDISGAKDIVYAARLGLHVLKHVFRVADLSSARFYVKIPANFRT